MNRILIAAVFAFASAAGRSGGLLELHIETTAGAPNAKAWPLRGRNGSSETVYLDSTTLLDAAGIAFADVERGPDGSFGIRLTLTAEGARTLAEITARHVRKRLGIVVDGQLRAAPFILDRISNGVLVVAGVFTSSEAAELARKLGPPAPRNPTGEPPNAGPRATSVPRAGVPDATAVAPKESDFAELRGSWIVIKETTTARKIDEGSTIGGTHLYPRSTWTFQGHELVVESYDGRKERFDLGRNAGSGPKAFQAAPAGSAGGNSKGMIFERDRDRLKIAYNSFEGAPPSSFEPRPGLVVLNLMSKSGMEAREPCGVLQGAGVEELMGGRIKLKNSGFEAPIPGPICVAEQQDTETNREVSLFFVQGVDRSAFEEEVGRIRKNPRAKVQSEPDLGAPAFSSFSGDELGIAALKNDTYVMLVFKLPGADPAKLRRFAKRVLSRF